MSRACSNPDCTGCWRCSSGGWLVHPPRSLFDNYAAVGAAAQESRFRRHSARHVQAAPAGGRHLRDQLLGCRFRHILRVRIGPIEPWTRAARKGARVQLTLEHLMASLSIPFLFRPIFLHQQYFGDGAMRQTSPLSPAIHLGRQPAAGDRRGRSRRGRLGHAQSQRRAHLRPDVRVHARFAVHGPAAVRSGAHRAASNEDPRARRIEAWC